MEPNLMQLQKVMAAGNNSIDNVLILKTNGEFELVQGAGASVLVGIDYVTRWNTFDANSDYVGIKASNDEAYLEKIMKWANEAWKRYETTKQIRITNISE